ncbi:MAG TPA: hypothetical protein VGL94_05205 [Ktedonobacteraceae bacterium]
MKLLVNWMYRLLTLLVVALAVFSGELFITRANVLKSSIPKSCVLVDDKTKTTQLKLSGLHLDQGTKNKLAAVFKADPNGQSSIGLDCRATSTPTPTPTLTPTPTPTLTPTPTPTPTLTPTLTPTPTPTPTVLYALTVDDLNQYCQMKGYNNVTRTTDAGGNPTSIFTCIGVQGQVLTRQQINTGGDLTYVEACEPYVPAGTNIQARYDDNKQQWDCVG